MNILVTGANGQLGNEMRLITKGSSDKYIFTDVTEQEGVDTLFLDITDIDSLRKIVKDNKVKCIINCAAYTNVDKAETDTILCHKLNAIAPKFMAQVMKENEGLLVHVSTDYVFGGDPYNTPCKEEQQGTPTGVYGKTKLEGEQNIINSGVPYIIIRTAWLYSEFGKNFVKTMMNLTATKPRLNVVFDQCGTPTYAGDLAEVIYNIISERKFEGNTGIYHYSNEGVCSWYDFTMKIAEISGNNTCDIQPCHSNEFPSPVVRPAYSVLDKTKIKETFNIKVPYWTTSLMKCMANLK
nr:NAD(P)-dependent oxidoreductase [uncultured Prevotella sp.]